MLNGGAATGAFQYEDCGTEGLGRELRHLRVGRISLPTLVRPSGPQLRRRPRESPVWFYWDGEAIWIIGGASFPANLKRDPRCALGIVDWDPTTGLSHHVGMRGRVEVLPFDPATARNVFRRYLGPDEGDWDPRFDYSVTGEAAGLTMVRFTPETVVVRDQSYKPTQWARAAPSTTSGDLRRF